MAYVIIAMNNGLLLHCYVSFALLAVLGAHVWTSVFNGHFKKHRGRAIGITMAGKGVRLISIPAARKAPDERMLTRLVLTRGDELRIHCGARHLRLKGRDPEACLGERTRRGRRLPQGLPGR